MQLVARISEILIKTEATFDTLLAADRTYTIVTSDA